eukprot:CAMPEP_0118682282 /NCGR_PEP_ID=MMETSP0800-20121206/5403_1 /TAXON_ID=210618 ORGANISM="Striatella unipunctata, Strain CCMP2910" /NCGR_SAMPLE_ID=MMETSP0800 /ASSEMBLY_ACC=CAM_ASM_000638 /LENGTH=486 /DNA_ID=CAMNT_0006578663 /DNA_START=30 /DNA_END=1490 /DNA_ORIENTATION=-
MQNGSGSGGDIFVLYKIVNSGTDAGNYNAFKMSRGSGVSLASIKRQCRALNQMNHLGAEGFHWRVRVDEKSTDGTKARYTWWDIQDENARLPVKEASATELENMFGPPKKVSADANTAKGAIRSLGKAIAGSVEMNTTTQDYGPRVSVIAFKLLDLVKMHDDFAKKHGDHAPVTPSAPRPPKQAAAPQIRSPPPARAPAPRQPPRAAPQPRPQAQPPRVAPPRQAGSPVPAPRAPIPTVRKPPAATGNLMDFGEPSSSQSSFSPMGSSGFPGETKAQKKQREYAKKKAEQKLVWDDVDQRYVAIDPKSGGAFKKGTTSEPPGTTTSAAPKKKMVGIKLDASNAVGKSAQVQAAVNQRLDDMKQSQEKAVKEIREREEKKKADEAEEDQYRRKLEGKIRVWSEEHGKKKQLRALLCSMHTVLWPGSGWKPVNLGDVLDASKCKKCYHKASRIVHPDKTGDLDPEKRFLAKRVFDALSQAKTAFDEGK